jgi:peptidoglycan/xylan/chitin deacetylase (PgdA/CDA1 family)
LDIPVSEKNLPTILTYHKIGSHLELGITTVGRSRFAAHMDFLLGLGLDFLKATDAVKGNRGRAAVAVTFDDGYESVYDEALPEMLPRGVTGTVFPVVGSVGGLNRWDVNLAPRPVRHLSWMQIREMAASGFEIGSHTLTHRDLTRLSPEALGRELRDSKKAIEDMTGVAVAAISYPFGRYSQRVLDAAAAAGYTCGFSSFPGTHDHPMSVGRWAVYATDGAASLERKLGLRSGRGIERLRNRVVASLSLGTTLVKDQRDPGSG